MSDAHTTLGLPCLTRQRANGGHALGPWDLCWHCHGAIEATILELPRDVYDLSQAIGRHNAPPERSGAHAKPGSKPPINLLIDALRSQIVYTASVWEEIVRDHDNLSPRRSGAMREMSSIVGSVQILAPRVDLLAALPPSDGYFDGVEAGLVTRRGFDGLRRLVGLHDLVRRILGHGPAVVRLPGTCRCGAATLRRESGSDTVWCDTCEGRWTYDDYTRFVRLMLGDAA